MQLNEGNPFFNHGHLSWFFSFKVVTVLVIMEAIPSCIRARNCTGFFGMPVNHTNCSCKLDKPKETALQNSAIYSSQNIRSWNLYKCQQYQGLRVKMKVFEKFCELPFLQ